MPSRSTSLAVNLGLARATLTDLPDEARKVIDRAKGLLMDRDRMTEEAKLELGLM